MLNSHLSLAALVLIDIFKNTDWEVTNVDAEFFGSSHHNLETVSDSKNYTFVKGNITNRKLMGDLISECDCIVNFAAESHVDRSILDANPFLISNIRGVFTILDILKERKKKLIQWKLGGEYNIYYLIKKM